MSKKILFYVILIITMFFLLICFLFIKLNINKKNYYTKYNTSIIISSEDLSNPIFLDVNNDGNALKISSNFMTDEGLIIDKYLYYPKKNNYYKFQLNKSYKDIYNILYKIKDVKKASKGGSLIEYDIKLSNKELNLLLDSLLFNKKSLNGTSGKIKIVDKKIVSFHCKVTDIDSFQNLNIDITFKELNDTYKINTDMIYGKNEMIPGNRKKIIETNENIFEIIK